MYKNALSANQKVFFHNPDDMVGFINQGMVDMDKADVLMKKIGQTKFNSGLQTVVQHFITFTGAKMQMILETMQ